MVRKSRINKNAYFLIGALIILAIIFFLPKSTNILTTGGDFRPQYCVEDNCIPDTVFQELPSMPADFNRVKLKIDSSLYPIMQDFSCSEWNADFSECLSYNPDEWYYKQPEFIGSPQTWIIEGYRYYIEGGSNPLASYSGTTGSGAFPSDIIIKPVNPGEDLVAITYVHSTWYVSNWQGMSLEAIYPSSAGTAVGTFLVDQDPNVVKNYFDVKIEPNVLLLEPSYPYFRNGWVQKVTMNIHVKPNTPPGKYLIALNIKSPPPEQDKKWFNQYEFAYHPLGGTGLAGGIYKAFIEVV